LLESKNTPKENIWRTMALYQSKMLSKIDYFSSLQKPFLNPSLVYEA